jgi:hypothetical protein
MLAKSASVTGKLPIDLPPPEAGVAATDCSAGTEAVTTGVSSFHISQHRTANGAGGLPWTDEPDLSYPLSTQYCAPSLLRSLRLVFAATDSTLSNLFVRSQIFPYKTVGKAAANTTSKKPMDFLILSYGYYSIKQASPAIL